MAPVVPEASNVKSSPSHITSFVTPLVKLITGSAVVFTVMVTAFEVALAMLDAIGHVLLPSVT